MQKESLGIIGLEAIVTYVPDLERSRRFYVGQLDFAEVGRSDRSFQCSAGCMDLYCAAIAIATVTS